MILLNQQKKKTKEHISTPNKKRIKKKPTNANQYYYIHMYLSLKTKKKNKKKIHTIKRKIENLLAYTIYVYLHECITTKCFKNS